MSSDARRLANGPFRGVEASGVRLLLISAFGAAELLLLSLAFSRDFVFEADHPAAAALSALADALPMTMILAAGLLGVGLARPGALAPILTAHDSAAPRRQAALAHLLGAAGFAATLASAQYGDANLSFNALLALLSLSAIVAIGGFLRVIAPFAAWRRLLIAESALIAAASAMAVTAIALGAAAQEFWMPLSDATLMLSRAILELFVAETIFIPEARILGAGAFRVAVDQQCSGYEGVALVLSFLAFFGYAFRDVLRFPHFLLLAPIGVIVIWLSNSVRIAALTWIGAEVSAPLAAGGFHSFAGLTLFLVVSLALMLIALRTPFFLRKEAVAAPRATPQQAEARRARVRLADALLIPFLALLLSGVALAMTVENPARLYPAQLGAMALALAAFARVYARLDWRPAAGPILAGLAVAVLWITAAPSTVSPERADLLSWLHSLPPTEQALWLLARGVGFILLIPIVEELAFRGYGHRLVAHGALDGAPEASFSWRAILVTAVLFGALHDRWIEGAIAGVIFSLAMLQTGRLSSAIYAHAAANGAIFAYVLATGDWAAL